MREFIKSMFDDHMAKAMEAVQGKNAKEVSDIAKAVVIKMFGPGDNSLPETLLTAVLLDAAKTGKTPDDYNKPKAEPEVTAKADKPMSARGLIVLLTASAFQFALCRNESVTTRDSVDNEIIAANPRMAVTLAERLIEEVETQYGKIPG